MTKIGITLLLAGLGGMVIYGVYSWLWLIYSESGIPLILKIVTPLIIIGGGLILIAVIRDRLRDKKQENLKEVEF